MAIIIYPSLIGFLISLVVSGIIIFIATKLFGENEGFGTAMLAAFIGAIIYAVAYYFFGGGFVASIFGGIAWLIALGSLYKMGWIKAFFVAIIIWLVSMLVSYVLPTISGPL